MGREETSLAESRGAAGATGGHSAEGQQGGVTEVLDLIGQKSDG